MVNTIAGLDANKTDFNFKNSILSNFQMHILLSATYQQFDCS